MNQLYLNRFNTVSLAYMMDADDALLIADAFEHREASVI